MVRHSGRGIGDDGEDESQTRRREEEIRCDDGRGGHGWRRPRKGSNRGVLRGDGDAEMSDHARSQKNSRDRGNRGMAFW